MGMVSFLIGRSLLDIQHYATEKRSPEMPLMLSSEMVSGFDEKEGLAFLAWETNMRLSTRQFWTSTRKRQVSVVRMNAKHQKGFLYRFANWRWFMD